MFVFHCILLCGSAILPDLRSGSYTLLAVQSNVTILYLFALAVLSLLAAQMCGEGQFRARGSIASIR
jgi:hypothetical protein